MPIYRYRCPRCGDFEVLKSMQDRVSSLCPECASESPIAPSMFSFKFFNPFTKDGEGFTTELAHPGKLRELQAENRRK